MVGRLFYQPSDPAYYIEDCRIFSSLLTHDVFGSSRKCVSLLSRFFVGSRSSAKEDMADYSLLSIENIYCVCTSIMLFIPFLNWISVFFRSHTGNWSLLNKDCYSTQINGVQTKSTLRVSVTSDI